MYINIIGRDDKLLFNTRRGAKTSQIITRGDLSKQLLVDGEPQVQVGRIILQNPLEGVEVLAVLETPEYRYTAHQITCSYQMWVDRTRQHHSPQTPCHEE